MKPLQRAGNRRYYRPADVALARRIHQLLSNEGYTVRGVQKLLREGRAIADEPAMPQLSGADRSAVSADDLRGLRDRLARALDG